MHVGDGDRPSRGCNNPLTVLLWSSTAWIMLYETAADTDSACVHHLCQLYILAVVCSLMYPSCSFYFSGCIEREGCSTNMQYM
jgi:hypothetical protein